MNKPEYEIGDIVYLVNKIGIGSEILLLGTKLKIDHKVNDYAYCLEYENLSMKGIFSNRYNYIQRIVVNCSDFKLYKSFKVIKKERLKQLLKELNNK